jgi:hypothetical protein
VIISPVVDCRGEKLSGGILMALRHQHGRAVDAGDLVVG